MSDLESLVAEAEARFEAVQAEAAAATEHARTLQIEAAKARAFVDGLRTAQAAIPATRVRQKPTDDGASRNRDLTPAWKTILSIVHSTHGTFDYDDLEKAAAKAGHETARDTLRSQMSLYKARGIVRPHGAGSFSLTDAGEEAVGAPPRLPAKSPVFGGPGPFDDLDDDTPF